MIPKKIIDDYEVYCVHPECEWIGKLSSLDFHMKTCEKEKKKKRELNEEISKKICILVEDVKSEHEVINIEENELNDEISLNFSDDFPFLDSNPFLVDTSIVLRMTFNDKKSYGIINSFHI